MGIALTEDELWAYLGSARTGILTTLRRDGWPVSLPLWFGVEGHEIVATTPVRAKKVARIRHDDRACFLVESGETWRELKAAVLLGRVAVVEDPDQVAAFDAAVERQQPAEIGVDPATRPAATNERYANKVGIRFTPTEPPLSWDNAKIRLRAPEAPSS